MLASSFLKLAAFWLLKEVRDLFNLCSFFWNPGKGEASSFLPYFILHQVLLNRSSKERSGIPFDSTSLDSKWFLDNEGQRVGQKLSIF